MPTASLRRPALVLLLAALLLAACSSSTGEGTSRWYWRNPSPQGNILTSAAYGNGTYVATGHNGTFVVSRDGLGWTLSATGGDDPTTATPMAVAYGNGTFVAVGNAFVPDGDPDYYFGVWVGVAFVSKDGASWTRTSLGDPFACDPFAGDALRQGGPGYTFSSLAFGNGTFVTVRGDGAYRSGDGATWEKVAVPGAVNLYRVAFGNGTFVATGDGASFTSADGVSWKANPLPLGKAFGLAFGKGAFVAVEVGRAYDEDAGEERPYTRIARSEDGEVWDEVVERRFGPAYTDVAFAGGRFVCIGGALNVFRSDDGATWTAGTAWTGGNDTMFDGTLSAAGDTFLILSQGHILSSGDGVNWSLRTRSAMGALPGDDFFLRAASFGGGRFVAVGGPVVLTSPDGASWNRGARIADRPAGAAYLPTLRSVSFGGDTFVAMGYGPDYALSTDRGVTWEVARVPDPDGLVEAAHIYLPPHAPGYFSIFNGLAWGNGRFVTFLPEAKAVAVSGNGRAWEVHPTGVTRTDGIQEIAFGNGRFVACGYNGLLAASADGVSWTEIDTGVPWSFLGIRFGNGRFVAWSDQVIFTSADGLAWTSHPLPTDPGGRSENTSIYFNNMGFGDGRFIALGNVGYGFDYAQDRFYESADGVTWKAGAVSPAENPGWTGGGWAFGRDTFVTVGPYESILQSAPVR